MSDQLGASENNPGDNLPKEDNSPHPTNHKSHMKSIWPHKPTPYICACIIWLIISYSPFFLFTSETILRLTKEDCFFENSGAIFLFLSSIAFFYLSFREKQMPQIPRLNVKYNIFFLFLGLLFFFGAGEEISWGQRIFNFKTPDIMASNVQHEFTIHNLPLFNAGELKNNGTNTMEVVPKKGYFKRAISINALFSSFCHYYLFIIAVLYFIGEKIRCWMDKIHFPAPPIWIGIIYWINAKLDTILQSYTPHQLLFPLSEIYEASVPFIFLILAIWFIFNFKVTIQHLS